ncbi:MAG: hypothetical protein SGJ11_06985 [Phycisphaerae bacterium]|nr:hypothetical protein [Phycisphaerae bacterium]
MRPSSIAMTSDARIVAVGCLSGATWIVAEPNAEASLIRGDTTPIVGSIFVDEQDLVTLSASGLLRRVDHRSGTERWSVQLEPCGMAYQRGSERIVCHDGSRIHVSLAGANDIAVTVQLDDGRVHDRVRRLPSVPDSIVGSRSNIVACTYLPARDEWLVANDASSLVRLQRDLRGDWSVSGELHGIPISFMFPTPDSNRAACISRTGLGRAQK